MELCSRIDPLFPDRLQGYGFATERKAIRAARDEIGNRAKQNSCFITLTDHGTWGWLSVSKYEYRDALIEAHSAQRLVK